MSQHLTLISQRPVGLRNFTRRSAWSPAQYLVLDSAQSWVSDLRTPLGLIDEGSGQFTLHYTGYSDRPGVGKYGSLGMLRLKLERP